MRILIPVLLLFCNLSFSQNQRFSYDYSFVKDTLNKQEVIAKLKDEQIDVYREALKK